MLCFGGFCPAQLQGKIRTLEVKNGILDLRDAPPEDRNSLIEFSGQWFYYPDQLLEKTPLRNESTIFADPSLFWQESAQKNFLSSQQASFLLVIKRVSGQAQLSLFLREMPRYKIIVNNRLVTTQGQWLPNGKGKPARGHRQVALPDTDEIEILLQTSTEGLRWQTWNQPMALGTLDAVQNWVQERTIVLSLILGGILVTGIYHIILFLLNRRKKAPLVLGLFCLCQVIRTVLGSEIDTVFHIWPHFPYELSYKIGYSVFFASVPLYIHFLYLSFLSTFRVWIVWAYWAFSAFFIAMAVVTPVNIYATSSVVFQLGILSSMFIMLLCLVRSLRRKMKGAYTLLAATLIFIIATINDILFFRSMIDTGEMIPFAVFLFILLQATILSSQVAGAFRELRHTYKELTKIAYLHMVQRIAAGFRVEQTMPIGTAEGTILCFDIVGSSKIRHLNFNDILERMMGRCYAAMSQHYNPLTLECRAYRIKEMGDGLLCSVGFPFHLTPHQNQASEALKLAIDFAKIFREEMEILKLPQDMCCAIGIASGPIEGFFPRFGIKQYDLRGHTIVLANRYEAMRNQVYQLHGKQGSVIFIQDQVFRRLSADEQAEFQHWDCTLEMRRIRDDPQALHAWFRFVEPARGQGEAAGSLPEAG